MFISASSYFGFHHLSTLLLLMFLNLLTSELGLVPSHSEVNALDSHLTQPTHNVDTEVFGNLKPEKTRPMHSDTDLKPDTNQAEDRRGSSNCGGRRRKKKPCVKMVPPSLPSISRLSKNSVMVRWTVAKNDGLPISFFKIQYRKFERGRRSVWYTVDADIAPYTNSYAVSDLDTGLQYKFRVAAVYSNNDHKIGGKSIKFTLLKNPRTKKPEIGPKIISAKPMSPSAIIVEWEFSNIETVGIDGFFIHYLATHKASEYLKVSAEGSATRTHIITHLQPGTAYDIKMQCFNIAGASEFSNVYTSKTRPRPDSENDIDNEKVVDSKNSNYLAPVTSKDDHTLYYVIGITSGALGSVFIVCIVLCVIKSKQQNPPAQDIPKAVIGNIIHGHQNLKNNHLNDKNLSISGILHEHGASGSASQISLNKNICDKSANLRPTTLERRRGRFVEEQYPNFILNPRVQLNGTLERKQKNRTDSVNGLNHKEVEVILPKCNGIVGKITVAPVILKQTSC